ncbi:MAG: NAD(P)-dependent oxidoreductase [Patescibacteria group bacterium]
MKKKFPKTLITGANGMVGSYVDFGIKTDRQTLDVTNLESVMSVVKKHNPKVILHLAAMTDLDLLEKNPSLAYFVNSVGTYNIALAARSIGAKVVFPSSTGVFDGTKKSPYTENDVPNPQNHYGHSKYIGEQIIRSMLDNYIIARSCWMFGGGPKNDKKFVAKIIAQLTRNEVTEIKALDDVKGSPTFGKDLVAAYKALIEKDARGIFHLTNKGVCTRFDVAKVIVETLKPSLKIRAVDSTYFNLPAVRVKNEASSSQVQLLRPWKDALKEYLEVEWSHLKLKK